jgi:hypothetical protein
MDVEGVTTDKKDENWDDRVQEYCCKPFSRCKYNSKITEHNTSFSDDKYYCIVDGFGYSILENILYCPYCGSKLVGC